MRLYLVRHAGADDRAGPGEDDGGLSQKARTRVLRVTAGLRKMSVRPELIFTSPCRSAIETARILGQGLGAPRMEEHAELASEKEPASLVGSLRPYFALEGVMIVADQPELTRLASFLMTGLAEGCELAFREIAAAFLRGELGDGPARFSLQWLLPRKALRRL